MGGLSAIIPPVKARKRGARLVYNPEAGRFPAGVLLPGAVNLLEQAGWKIEIVEATSSESLTQSAAEAAEEGLAAVFVAGGDGSVGRVAGALAGSDTALGVLPSGTANVWAKELGLPTLTWANPLALAEAARRLARGKVRPVDLGSCNGRPFLLWAGMGFDGKVVNSIGPRQPWGRAFVVAQHAVTALWEAVGWTGVDLRVTGDDGEWAGRYVVAVASNIRAYAGGLLELSPQAKVDDGQLEFWLVEGSSMADVVASLVKILLGTHFEDPRVVHFTGRRARFESDSPLPMHLDGEPVAIPSPVEISIRPAAVRVLTPAGGWPAMFADEIKAAKSEDRSEPG